MKSLVKLAVLVVVSVLAVSTQAHEGHATVGTIVHEIEHAGWMAGALMLGSVMILLVFSASVKFADKHLPKTKRRD